MTVIDIEKRHADFKGIELAPRAKREMLAIGMYARLLVEVDDEDGVTRHERVWVKIYATDVIMESHPPDPPVTEYRYAGMIVGDPAFAQAGHQVEFGPEHVCEWGVTDA